VMSSREGALCAPTNGTVPTAGTHATGVLKISGPENFTVVVTQIGGRFGAWQYEIHRDGKPLPARVRDTGFRTRQIAMLAGNAALQDLLLGLAQEQSKHD
jgi:hypothetical protein